MDTPITRERISEVEQTIRPHIRRTPVLELDQSGDAAGLVGDQRPLGDGIAALLGPHRDLIARRVGPLAAAAGVGDGEDGKADGYGKDKR